MTIRKRLLIPLLIYTLSILFIFLISLGNNYILTAARAFVGAESLWSKAEKNSVQTLTEFLIAGDRKLIAEFHMQIQVMQSDQMARIELLKQSPDFEKSDRYLISGGNDPKEVRRMGYIFRYARSFPAISKALTIWTNADERLKDLYHLAEEIEVSTSTGAFRTESAREFASQLSVIDDDLTRLEKEFTLTIVDGSRQVEDLAFWINLISILALAGSAFFLGAKAIRDIIGEIDRLESGIRRFSRGERNFRFLNSKVPEFNLLAQAFNNLLDTNLSAEKTLTEQMKFEVLIKALHRTAIISMTDEAGRIEMANDRFCAISGYSRDELLGETHRVINSGHHPKAFFSEMWRTILKGEVWSGEVCNRAKNGQLYWVDSTITPVIGVDDKRKFLSIRYDITKRKELEAQVIQSSKMASLGEMSAGLAHEINNPAAIVSGKVSHMRRLLADPNFTKEMMLVQLEKTEYAVDRIARIVRGLLNFSRESTGDSFQPTPIKTIIDESLSLCQSKLQSKGIEVRIDEIPELEVLSKESQISQILLNLCSNAVDAVEPLHERWIEITTAINNGCIEIRVTDSGSGIPPEISKKIMEPFFTTKVVGRGTGLGLSISKGIAEVHNGSLRYDASAKNTSFVLTLPILKK